MDAIYLDFMKAFDMVPYNRLIGKLRSYSLSGKIVRSIYVCKQHKGVSTNKIK